MLFKKSALVLAAALLAAGSAQAVLPNATTNLSVNIVVSTSNVSTACYLQNGSVAPTNSNQTIPVNVAYTSGSAVASNQYGNVRVQCTGNDAVPVVISANPGLYSNGSTRRASGNAGADFINYTLQIFSPSIMGNTIWDDATTPAFSGAPITTTASTSSSGPGLATTSSVTMGFQLIVPANQAANQGTYTDVVLLTATF
jgi:spore coat protein U-like protein